jgi:hypothetical protein
VSDAAEHRQCWRRARQAQSRIRAREPKPVIATAIISADPSKMRRAIQTRVLRIARATRLRFHPPGRHHSHRNRLGNRLNRRRVVVS